MENTNNRNMEKTASVSPQAISGDRIVSRAEAVGLDQRLLYNAVIDLSSEGLITANCINMAAGILLQDLGLPNYFFNNIAKESLKQILGSIASNITFKNGKPVLYGRVAHVDFDLQQGCKRQLVRMATEETRDRMEELLHQAITGHRREYYYNPESQYYTYIVQPETVSGYKAEAFKESRFLFHLTGDDTITPERTKRRYETFLEECENSLTPFIQVFDVQETGETRMMFNTNFESPQLPVLRKIVEDHGLSLVRGYWEPYLAKSAIPSAIMAMYVRGHLTAAQKDALANDISAFLSYGINSSKELYIRGDVSLNEMLFAGNAIDFTRMFIFKESEILNDKEIKNSLVSRDYKDSFANRIHSSNRSIYRSPLIEDTIRKNVDLVKILYEIFEQRFHPSIEKRLSSEDLEVKWKKFEKKLSSRFIDFRLGYDIFKFMFKIVSCTLKTNFFKKQKRAFSFRFSSDILDPLVFSQCVYGIFFVNGHYASGTHMRADDIARGGLRLIRSSRANYESELDNAVLLNYALGPMAQRLKHKDICESGSKGVIVPRPHYKDYSKEAVLDYTEGILDLIMPDDSVVDHYGKNEMIFFGPDEGTAQFMDCVSFNSKRRGYKYWRTLTSGKSFGIPHDTYGLLDDGNIFGLFDNNDSGVALQVNGERLEVTNDMEVIHNTLAGTIQTSGMTTTSVMSTFRTLIAHYNEREEDLNLMITGGPDGDLGANQIQCYKGKICLVIDGGSILFDPQGLDRKELLKIAFKRNSSPRLNTLAYPADKLSEQGFIVPISGKEIALPDGSVVEDGALFHRTFFANQKVRKFIAQANIKTFIPCGGFKDTINRTNIKEFVQIFNELRFVVEGANVFFDDVSRRYIGSYTDIKQIKDSTANKGGVFCSSIAEVLTPFLLKEEYEEILLNDNGIRWQLIKDITLMVAQLARTETKALLQLHEADSRIPLFELSESTSEKIFAFQETLMLNIEEILRNQDLVWTVLQHYIPAVLVAKLGKDSIMQTLNSPDVQTYRNAILTKKLASLAFYTFCLEWDQFLSATEQRLMSSIIQALDGQNVKGELWQQCTQTMN